VSRRVGGCTPIRETKRAVWPWLVAKESGARRETLGDRKKCRLLPALAAVFRNWNDEPELLGRLGSYLLNKLPNFGGKASSTVVQVLTNVNHPPIGTCLRLEYVFDNLRINRVGPMVVSPLQVRSSYLVLI
jgi:hypothetical protein